jgi:hypothetical protein
VSGTCRAATRSAFELSLVSLISTTFGGVVIVIVIVLAAGRPKVARSPGAAKAGRTPKPKMTATMAARVRNMRAIFAMAG